MNRALVLALAALLLPLATPGRGAGSGCDDAEAALEAQLGRGVWDAALAHAILDAQAACPTATTNPGGPVHPPVNVLRLDPVENPLNPALVQGCRPTARVAYPASFSLSVAGPPPFQSGVLGRQHAPGTVWVVFDPFGSPRTSANGDTDDTSFGLYADTRGVGWIYLHQVPVPARFAELTADCGGDPSRPVCRGDAFAYTEAGRHTIVASLTFEAC